MVLRVYVEKIKGFDVEASQLKADLIQNLGVSGLKELRIINRYDAQGLSEDEFQAAASGIFSEANQDHVYGEDFSLPEEYQVFAVEYLPGQYDQRADSAAQCIQLLTQGDRPQIATAKLIALKGVSAAEKEQIQEYYINPVESRLASMDKPASLDLETFEPADVARVTGFISFDDGQMQDYYSSMGFAMTLEDLLFCRDYFKNQEHRDPSVTELRVIDTYWSDHCRHTTFLTKLENISIEKGPLSEALESALAQYFEKRAELYGRNTDRPVTLMDMATLGGKYLHSQGLVPDLDISEEINACSIEVPVTIDGVEEPWLIQFKNETHNHPTEIEPFGGAATCLGGAIRDPLSGRAYVYQAMRVTGSSDPTVPVSNTLPGKLPARTITTGAAAGYSSYGNQIGLATGQVTELYDPGYMAKRMEIGAVIGASPKSNVRRETPLPGDIIVLLGGATGRDGIGGATGSSKAHTEKSVELCGAEVQKGNPPTERKIQRLFRNPKATRLIKRCNDFGAGGVCVAIGELSPGLEIDLNAVPKKYKGLDGTELAISESQERMAVVLAKEDVELFQRLSKEENLEACPVAVVTENPRLKMTWREDLIVDLSREFLDTNGVTQTADAVIQAPTSQDYRTSLPEALKGKSGRQAFIDNLKRLEVCSQKGLAERFDSSIGSSTVLMPFAGTYQLTPEEAMVARLPVENGDTKDATAMSYGYIPGIMKYSPFYGAAYSVVESLSKLAAVGANPLKARLSFQEYFERLQDNPKRWGKPTAALLGALSAQLGMGIPSIGGKDSMSGSFEDLDVPPTLVSFAVSMTTTRKTLSACMSPAGIKVVLLPIPTEASGMPDWEKLSSYYEMINMHTQAKDIVAMSVVREGGAAAAVARMCFGEKLGFRFSNELSPEQLYAPMAGAIVAQLSSSAELRSELGAIPLGFVRDNDSFELDGVDIAVEEAISAYEGTLEKVFPQISEPVSCGEVPLYTERNGKGPSIRKAQPRVLIPAFPGTNCEVDSAMAFKKAGGRPELLVVRNIRPSDIEETIARLEKSIRSSQIIMLPGGFSGGDEPEGSGKFIATTFRNPRIANAVSDLLENRDGLILGICNGFQALIKLGLLPYGKITEIHPDSPTLTYNSLGRHASRMVYTRITSVKSPWMAGVLPGDLHTIPISHTEGRFVADEKTLAALAENGQIATQYCNPDGEISGETLWNPNGSVYAIEGITSPDGRILGKMGHSERKGSLLYNNVPGDKDQHLFESGVRYFG